MLAAIGKLIALGVHTAIVAPIVVGVAVIDDRWAYYLCRQWARTNLFLFGIDVKARRIVPLDATQPYVFMSNHRSNLDVLALMDALEEFQLRWVAKKELLDVPLFGWALKNAGHIIVDRSNTAQAVASMRAAKAQMGRGVSVIIFPEGTRSPSDDVLLPLKKGGFMLAIETDTPIVPVAVRGSRRLLPRDSWHIRGGTIDVIVGAPISTAGRSREELTTMVETFLQEELQLPEPTHAPPILGLA